MPEVSELERARQLVAGAEAAAIKVERAKELISEFLGLVVEEVRRWDDWGDRTSVDIVAKSLTGHPVERMALVCYHNGTVDLHFSDWHGAPFDWFQDLYNLLWKEINPGIPRIRRCW